MGTSGISRRSFIATSMKAGAIAAGSAAGLGALLESGTAWAGPAEPLIVQPSQPSGHRSYVTRPDLRPPSVTIETAAGFPFSADQPEYIFCSPMSTDGGPYPAGAQGGLMILSLTGEVIWFSPIDNSIHPFNFRVQSYKNNPVLTWFQGAFTDVGYATSGNGVIADASYQSVATVKAVGYQTDLHELLLTTNGTALVAAYEPGVAGPDGTLVNCHAQEIDVASGGLLFDWTSYPAVPVRDSYVSTVGDYFHLNSIDLWPGSAGSLLVSSRNTSAVYLIDTQAGGNKAILWRAGGKQSSFKMGPNANFHFQHDARALTDGSGISVFDDASQPSDEKQSSGKVITLDQKTMTSTLRHQYLHTDRAVDTPREGNCQLLGNGAHVVGWGASPYFSEFRASGNAKTAELILDGRFPANVDSYRTFMFDWTGSPPNDELRLVVRATGASGHFTAWVSWNGATEVARWRLSAGPSASSLEVLTSVEKTSFETAINFTRDGARAFRVAALKADGSVLPNGRVEASI